MMGELPGMPRHQEAGTANHDATVADGDAALDESRHVRSGSIKGGGRCARPSGSCVTPLRVMPVHREDGRSREGPIELVLVGLIARAAFEEGHEMLDLNARLVRGEGAPAVEPAPELPVAGVHLVGHVPVRLGVPLH